MQAITFTATQKAALQAIAKEFAAIEGDYERTVLAGVWHAYCDSGIMTDAFSVNDAVRVHAASIDTDELFALDEINDAVKAYDNKGDLDCVRCVNAIVALGVDIEDAADYMLQYAS